MGDLLFGDGHPGRGSFPLLIDDRSMKNRPETLGAVVVVDQR